MPGAPTPEGSTPEGLAAVRPESVGLSSERLARIGSWMRAYADAGRIPGALTLVARQGRPAYLATAGYRDVAAERPVEADSIYRVYSMTKPVVTVAAMTLWEEGRLRLDDPVSRFIPAFADVEVFTGGDADRYTTEPAEREMTVRDLMTHTSGLTYWFLEETPVDALYRRHGIIGPQGTLDLAGTVEALARLPLLAHPGREWNYSIATDVLGHVVEIVSGERLDRFLDNRILRPLGMTDTAFTVPDEKLARFAANYARRPDDTLELVDTPDRSPYRKPWTFLSGGGGLVSTAGDYFRFLRMLAGGGALDGVRLLGRKTVAFMTENHLPGDMASMGQARFSESTYHGVGFGLGFAVVIDPPATGVPASRGTYAWGGAASTAFFVDPVEELIVVFLTQLMPSSSYRLRDELRVLVYQALVD